MRWAGNVACMGGKEECIQNFDWKAKRKETIRKTQTRRGDNIKTDLRE
jgi:hypothetical protein